MTQATKKRVKKRSNTTSQELAALPTLKDHLHELQGRLFSIVLVFILAAAAAYPFFDKITAFLIAPLRPGQELVYLTPGGAFSFIIKVCAYVGIVATLPMIIFHLYRFIMPAVRQTSLWTVLKYTIASLVLAVCGVLFAYYVSLPAAIQFLTGFNLNHIDAMLTIDSYFSFIMAYMIAGALLFQLPLVMLIINSVTPLTPKKLMGAQRHMLVGSFIIAAIISPTPDALNQTLLASPVVVMYQISILLIWRTNARARRRVRKAASVIDVEPVVTEPTETVLQVAEQPDAGLAVAANEPHSRPAPKRRAMDMICQSRPTAPVVAVPPRESRIVLPERSVPTPSPGLSAGIRTIDGVIRMPRVA